MKKFMKSCAITALVLIVLGLILAVTAGGVKGRIAITEVVDSVTDGKVHINLNGLKDWGITVREDIVSELGDDISYDIEDSMIFDNDFEILKGDVEKYSVGSAIKNLEVEVGGCSFQVKASGDNNFYVEAAKTKKFQGYVHEQTLHIKGTMENNLIEDFGDCEIILYVPDNFTFDKVDMELGAGQMEFNNLSAKEVALEVGAGQITTSSVWAEELDISVGMGELIAKDMQVKKLEAEVDMGHFYAEGDITESASVECNMGSIEMEVEGEWKDFNYDLECGMGNLQVGDDTYSGIASEKQIENMADKEMEVKCAMGNIQIDFTE